MIVQAGSVDVTTFFVLRTAADGTATTGATITAIDLQYCRSGAAPSAKVDATALAATDSAHADNKAIEIDVTDQPGLYRVDWPDAAFASGVREVILSVKLASSFTEHLRVELSPAVDVQAVDGDETAAANLNSACDNYSATRGLTGTALPAAAADGVGGVPISDAGELDIDAKLANTNEVTAARMGALTDWINGGRLDLLLDAIPTTAMRGTDNAALASVLGALADAAAAGEVTEADTLVQYVKQLINVLIGAPGIGAFPAEAAPGNAVSLAEVIRAIHVDVTGLNGSAMRGTNSANTTVPDAAGTAPTAAEIKTALEANGSKLDHLWETTEDDVGVRRFTENALEQGPSGSGLNAQETRDALKLAASAGDPAVGSVDKHLDDIVADTTTDIPALLSTIRGADSDTLETLSDQIDTIEGGTGSGARTVAVTVNDGTDALENANVRFTEGANTYVGSTNATGEVSFSLDDATYALAISKSGYSFTPTTLVVDGDETETYSMTAVSITAPPSASTTTGVMTVYDEEGSVEEGVEVSVQIIDGPGTDGIGYDSTVWTETSSALGVVEFAGIILGARYKIWRGDSKPLAQTFTAPTSGDSFDLAEVIGRG